MVWNKIQPQLTHTTSISSLLKESSSHHTVLFGNGIPDTFEKSLEKPASAATITDKGDTPAPKRKPIVLLIFDGWGVRQNGPGNAINEANPEHYQQLLQTYPWMPLEASGEAVGLPNGQAGNSEVGHLTIGSGRVFLQDLPRINKAIQDGSFFSNPVFMKAINHAKQTGGTLHLMGLVSDGGVHSHMNHLLALIAMAKQQGIKDVKVHAFLDGRDTPPKSAKQFLGTVESKLRETGYSPIATVSGRYYAMDRDKRWERVQKAYDNLVTANGSKLQSSVKAVDSSYQNNETDEFVKPCVTDPNYEGMKDGDSLLFFNFRPDRARQIARAFTDEGFNGFERQKVLQNTYFGGMTLYDESLNVPIAFPKPRSTNVLADILSANGLNQFHTAETEKYAHVTYFFNGGVEAAHQGEDRQLVPSPKVATYDLKPEMSVKEVADEVVNAINSAKYPFIVANFANPDMVGHTGKQPAAVNAVKHVDKALHRVVQEVLKAGGTMLLTADHGKVEQMVDNEGNPHTAHTTSPVPLVLISKDPAIRLKNLPNAGLRDVAPTILELFKLPIPPEMTGTSLLSKDESTPSANDNNNAT